MEKLYGEIRDRVYEQLTVDTEELSCVSKALYLMGEKEASAKHMLQEEYGVDDAAAELLYDVARPVYANGPERVFDRLEPLTDEEDASYTDPDML